MQQAILIVILIFGTLLALKPRSDITCYPPHISKQYRDYEYNAKSNTFYKLHIESKTGLEAEEICKNEGAQLMVPSDEEDIAKLHRKLKEFPDIGDIVFIGNDEEYHEDAEEANIFLPPTSSEILQQNDPRDCEIIRRTGEVEITSCHFQHPFMCKVKAKDAPYDKQCHVYSKGYKYFDNVRSCYKISQTYGTWEQARAWCQAENAHLVVLNSEAESQTVKELLKAAPTFPSNPTKTIIPLVWGTDYLYAGIKKFKPRVFITIFNETLEEAGFNVWSHGEPNNERGVEYCGSINRKNGKYNDVVCGAYFYFVCEKEAAKQGYEPSCIVPVH